MRLVDFAEMGFKNLWRRKLRTILTMVGVSIGAFSIVIMLSLGIAMTESYRKQLEQWGSLTKITIERYGYIYDENTGIGMSQENKLDDTLVQTIQGIEHVQAVTPIMSVQANLKSGKYQSWCSITGIDPDTLKYLIFQKLSREITFQMIIQLQFYLEKMHATFIILKLQDILAQMKTQLI